MPIDNQHFKNQLANDNSQKDHANAPIGLFDSGVGGLSVYQHLSQLLPNENYLYFADTLNVPYGGREHKQIVDLTLKAVDWLYNKGCKLIVIACNSASAHGLQIAREVYSDIPIVGLVPALKPAVLASQLKHVAVLATGATLNGSLFNDVIDHIATPQQTKVTKHFEPSLVPWVEAGMPTNSATADKLRQLLAEFQAQGIDQLVLGCTHYPFFRAFAEDYIHENGWQMQVVDSGFAIASRVQQLLQRDGLLKNSENTNSQAIDSENTSPQPLRFFASKYDERLPEILQGLLGKEVEVSHETY